MNQAVMDTHIVIMAGGVGSRLWPLSTPQMPKQFVDVIGVGKSLLQLTVDRFSSFCARDKFWVVTSENYVDTVRRQLPDIPESRILAEPIPRNTAPAIAYACRKIAAGFPDANVVVTPSDAIVLDVEKFRHSIALALSAAASSGNIVTIGVRPTRPETGYGYIKAETPVCDTLVKVEEFKEKPDSETASEYLRSGNYFWNAGIFVWNVKTMLRQLHIHAPELDGLMERISMSFDTASEPETLRKLFPLCEKISIDYAVMEKSDDILVIGSDIAWSDLGSWSSLGENIMRVRAGGQSHSDGNVAVGSDVRLFGCRNDIVHVQDAGTVIIEGLDGYIVSLNKGNLLICRKSEEQRIKDFSAQK